MSCVRQKLLKIPFNVRKECNSEYYIDHYLGKGSSGMIFFSCYKNNCKFAMKIIDTTLNNLDRYIKEAETLYHLGQLELSAKWYDTFYCDEKDFSIDKFISKDIPENKKNDIIKTFNEFTLRQSAPRSPKIYIVIISEFIEGRTLEDTLSISTTDEQFLNIYLRFISFINEILKNHYYP